MVYLHRCLLKMTSAKFNWLCLNYTKMTMKTVLVNLDHKVIKNRGWDLYMNVMVWLSVERRLTLLLNYPSFLRTLLRTIQKFKLRLKWMDKAGRCCDFYDIRNKQGNISENVMVFIDVIIVKYLNNLSLQFYISRNWSLRVKLSDWIMVSDWAPDACWGIYL